MAISERINSRRVSIKLDTGESTATGMPKTTSVNMGTMSLTAWDAQKAMNIVDALIPIFMYSYITTVHTVANDLIETA